MIETLKHIDSEYLLITLDDNFIVSRVETDKFKDSINLIKTHRRIASLFFMPSIDSTEKTTWFGDFGVYKHNKFLRVNMTTAIWRTKSFKKLLVRGESIWDFEGLATDRALYDFSYYCRYRTGITAIIDAPCHQRRGYGIVQGKWAWRNPELFSDHNIQIDFEKRGLMTKDECIANLERDNAGDKDYFAKQNEKIIKKMTSYLKRYIPVKTRIFLSKIKRKFIKSGD